MEYKINNRYVRMNEKKNVCVGNICKNIFSFFNWKRREGVCGMLAKRKYVFEFEKKKFRQFSLEALGTYVILLVILWHIHNHLIWIWCIDN